MENILKYLTLKKDVAFLNKNDTFRQGIEKFKAHGYTAVPILNDDGTYCGVITEGDFLHAIVNSNFKEIRDLEDINLCSILRKNIPSCQIDVDINEVIEKIINFNFIPIVDDRNILMGIITRKSIINYLKEKNNLIE